MMAYIAVSSIAEPMPCASRIAKHHAANGTPGGSRLATEKRIVEMETIEIPQM